MDTERQYSWDDDWKSADEANRVFYLPQADSGYVLRIDEVGDPKPSKNQYPDPKTGKLRPPAIQTRIAFTIVDGPDPKAVGQYLYGYYTISMNTKANFYKMVKKVFGGEVDPRWKPNRPDLMGKLVGAEIGHKDPNASGLVYPRIEAFSIYRGTKTYDDIPLKGGSGIVPDDDVGTANDGSYSQGESDEDVPF